MLKVSLLLLCLGLVCVFGDGVDIDQNATDTDLIDWKALKDSEAVGREMIEEGRTFVHHTIKRFMIILPAIFFKLGVAFTLLLLVTVVAVNNGFIGFLILVVGLSSVLARLQEARRPPPTVPIVYAPHAYGHHHHLLDRSDNVAEEKPSTKSSYLPQYQNYQYSNPQPDLRYTDVYYNTYANQKL